MSDLDLRPLHFFPQFHLLTAFRNTHACWTFLFLSSPAPKLLKNLSNSLSLFHRNIQQLRRKAKTLNNSFCHTGSNFGIHYPVIFFALSSHQSRPEVSNLFLNQ